MPKTADAATRRPAPGRALWLVGPALVAGVAYLDPGNVASNMTAGATFGYLLVWVVVLGNVMAWLIQYLSAKLGIVTGESLPQVLGRRIRRPWARRAYWLQAELVAMATDVAEVIGGAVALHLLFGIPLVWGGAITGLVSMGLLLVQTHRGARAFETVLIGLLVIIAVGFSAGLLFAPPDAAGVAGGLVPRFEGTTSVLLAASILGATIMPHAIYAHSALARDRFAPAAGAWASRCVRASRVRASRRARASSRTPTRRTAPWRARGGSRPRACCAPPAGMSRSPSPWPVPSTSRSCCWRRRTSPGSRAPTVSRARTRRCATDSARSWRRCSRWACSRADSPRPRSAPTPAPRS